MTESEKLIRHRFLHDKEFRDMVNSIESLIHKTRLTPNEFHDAVDLAVKRNFYERHDTKEES